MESCKRCLTGKMCPTGERLLMQVPSTDTLARKTTEFREGASRK
jgi:hypothetical protein